LGLGPKDTSKQEDELLGNFTTAKKQAQEAENKFNSETAG
jgi:hypothetical protein